MKKALMAQARMLLSGVGCVLALGAVSTGQAAAWKNAEVVAIRYHEQLTTRPTQAGQAEQAAGEIHLLYIRAANDIYVVELIEGARGHAAHPALRVRQKIRFRLKDNDVYLQAGGRYFRARLVEKNPASIPRKDF